MKTKKKIAPANVRSGFAPKRVTKGKRDAELVEAWTRDIEDASMRYVHGVEAAKHADSAWPWRVTVWVLEGVRGSDLEDELRRSIDAALRAVAGVTNVAEEDREVWVIAGAPAGDALVDAVGAIVDAFAERATKIIASTR